MKTFVTFFILFVSANLSFADDKEFAHHPPPKEPVYLKSSLYESFKKQISQPPDLKSAGQESDEKELFNLQSSRTEADCAQAKAEVFVNLKSFYGAPEGSLKDQDILVLNDFFEQMGNDANYFIQKMKKDFPRQRPYAYVKGIHPCVPKEVSGAYPSGHAALSKLFASILTDFFPADRDKFEKRAIEIGKHRVLSGVHHPTDIESGRKLGDLIYNELKQTKKYQFEVKERATKLNAR